jgi:hypothetical protein
MPLRADAVNYVELLGMVLRHRADQIADTYWASLFDQIRQALG